MNTPTVSVIVPVYNVEAYLPRCIDSILAQTFTDFELILVDDGSPDRCGEICEEYAAKDPRVRVIHKENGGVSSARNAGIQLSSGCYLTFCDSDDSLPENALEVLVNAMQSYDSELIVGDLIQIYANGKVMQSSPIKRAFFETPINNSECLYKFWISNNMLSSYGKLFCKTIITKNNLLFDPKLIVMEDYAFVIDYVSFCQKICMIPDVVYNYMMRETSVVERRSRKDFIFDVLFVSNKLSSYLQSLSIDDCEFQKHTIYGTIRLAYDILWTMDSSDLQSRLNKYKLIKKAIKNNVFQEMLRCSEHSFEKFEYLCLKHKCLSGILFLHGIQRFTGKFLKKNANT